MNHVNEGTLQALLDDELPPPGRAEAEHHLDGCSRCAAELDLLRATAAELSLALSRTDLPAPTEAAHAAVLRRRRRNVPQPSGFGPALRRAAVVVLGVAGAAAAAVPGSPVRDWIAGGSERQVADPVSAPVPFSASAAEPAEAASGVSILPADGEVRVLLVGPAPELEVRVRLWEGDRAEVEAQGAATGARFRTGPGRIEVIGAGAGEVHVRLPSSAHRASVEIDGAPYLSKEGEQLRVFGGSANRADAEITFRAGS